MPNVNGNSAKNKTIYVIGNKVTDFLSCRYNFMKMAVFIIFIVQFHDYSFVVLCNV